MPALAPEHRRDPRRSDTKARALPRHRARLRADAPRVGDACRERGVTIPYEVVAWIGARIADALHHAHELTDEAGRAAARRAPRREPANILLTLRRASPSSSTSGWPRRATGSASTARGVVKGKLAYLAPEQARGERVDRRADVFALGVTLWELSLGRRLFKSDEDLETLQRVLTSEVPDAAPARARVPRPSSRASSCARRRGTRPNATRRPPSSRAISTRARKAKAPRRSRS